MYMGGKEGGGGGGGFALFVVRAFIEGIGDGRREGGGEGGVEISGER